MKIFLVERSEEYKKGDLYPQPALVGMVKLLGIAKPLFPFEIFFFLIHSLSTDTGPWLFSFLTPPALAWYSFENGTRVFSDVADCLVEMFFS
jgi:hypothetical protein